MLFPFLWELLLGVYFVDQIENATFQHFEILDFGAFSFRNSTFIDHFELGTSFPQYSG